MSVSRFVWLTVLLLGMVAIAASRADDPCGDGRNPTGKEDCDQPPGDPDQWVYECDGAFRSHCEGKSAYFFTAKRDHQCSVPNQDPYKGVCVDEVTYTPENGYQFVNRPCGHKTACEWFDNEATCVYSEEFVACVWYVKKVKVYMCAVGGGPGGGGGG